jgi:hypothetical protein
VDALAGPLAELDDGAGYALPGAVRLAVLEQRVVHQILHLLAGGGRLVDLLGRLPQDQPRRRADRGDGDEHDHGQYAQPKAQDSARR